MQKGNLKEQAKLLSTDGGILLDEQGWGINEYSFTRTKAFIYKTCNQVRKFIYEHILKSLQQISLHIWSNESTETPYKNCYSQKYEFNRAYVPPKHCF